MSAINFRFFFSEVLIPKGLLEMFSCLTFISNIEARNMIADSSKPNKLSNVYSIRNHHPKTETLLYLRNSNTQHIKFYFFAYVFDVLIKSFYEMPY